MGQGQFLVIIPAFNEEDSIEKVVRDLQNNLPQAEVLVVNDGSTDDTSAKAKASRALVLDLPFNLGIGGAVQAGFKYAYKKGYEIAIQVDGDGQHDPQEIPKLLKALEEKKVDLVIGSRFLGSSMFKSSRMRRIGIIFFSRLISFIVGQKVTDPTSGFRAANRKAIRLFAFDYPQDYPEPEVLVLLHRYGLKMVEVPINMSPRFAGESSITTLRSLYYMIKVLLAILVDCFKRPQMRLGGEDAS